MSRISRVNLFDKDIRALAPMDKVYKKAVDNPKELYIKIYQGIYSVAKARRDAIEIIKKFDNGFIRSKDKYLLGTLFENYIEKKR